jgi:hypothetical protein
VALPADKELREVYGELMELYWRIGRLNPGRREALGWGGKVRRRMVKRVEALSSLWR